MTSVTADVFYGRRKHGSQHEDQDVVEVDYFSVCLNDGKVIFCRCTNDKSVEAVRRCAVDIIKEMKKHNVLGFRLRDGMRLRSTNSIIVFCRAAEHTEVLRGELREEFLELELTALSPPPVRDEREVLVSR